MSRMMGAIVVVVALVSTACADDGDTEGAEGNGERKVLRIGAAISESGDLFEPGSRVKRGYEFWAKTVNEQGGIEVGDDTYTVELVTYDDESDATTAARLADRLITEDEVDFMFGPYGSSMALAVGAITERHEVVMVQPGGNADNLYEQGWQYMFGIIPKASTLPGFWLEAMLVQQPRPETLGILSKDDVFAQAQREGLKLDADNEGVELVLDEVYSPEQTDFSSPVQQLRSADPDIVAVLGHTEDSASIVRQMREQRYYPGGVFFSGPALPDFLELLGDESNFSFGLTFWDPAMGWSGPLFGSASDYGAAFEEEYGEAPSYQNATASAAGLVLQLAIQEAQSLEPAAVREALLTNEFPTFEGPISYEQTGLNQGGRLGIQQILDGSVELIFPEDLASAEPVYPVPGWTER